MAEGGGSASGPRDAAVMEAILKEMGVVDYEPNVIHQMLEFSYSWSKKDSFGLVNTQCKMVPLLFSIALPRIHSECA